MLILTQKEKDFNLKRKKREELVVIYKWTDHGPLDVYCNFMIPLSKSTICLMFLNGGLGNQRTFLRHWGSAAKAFLYCPTMN